MNLCSFAIVLERTSRREAGEERGVLPETMLHMCRGELPTVHLVDRAVEASLIVIRRRVWVFGVDVHCARKGEEIGIGLM